MSMVLCFIDKLDTKQNTNAIYCFTKPKNLFKSKNWASVLRAHT